MKFSDYIKDIEDFYRSEGIIIDPIPRISIDDSKNDRFDPFIATGSYDIQNNVIILRVNERHLKDILRSFCHELVHHSQFLLNHEYAKGCYNSSLQQNEKLQNVEGEAYLKGNILFRKWTEKYTKST